MAARAGTGAGDAEQLLSGHSGSNHASRRNVTNTPLQKLFVLNHQFMVKRAERFVERILKSSGQQTEQIQWTYLNLFGRAATQQETQLASTFLGQNADVNRWRQYVQVLFASNEFMFLD